MLSQAVLVQSLDSALMVLTARGSSRPCKVGTKEPIRNAGDEPDALPPKPPVTVV